MLKKLLTLALVAIFLFSLDQSSSAFAAEDLNKNTDGIPHIEPLKCLRRLNSAIQEISCGRQYFRTIDDPNSTTTPKAKIEERYCVGGWYCRFVGGVWKLVSVHRSCKLNNVHYECDLGVRVAVPDNSKTVIGVTEAPEGFEHPLKREDEDLATSYITTANKNYWTNSGYYLSCAANTLSEEEQGQGWVSKRQCIWTWNEGALGDIWDGQKHQYQCNLDEKVTIDDPTDEDPSDGINKITNVSINSYIDDRIFPHINKVVKLDDNDIGSTTAKIQTDPFVDEFEALLKQKDESADDITVKRMKYLLSAYDGVAGYAKSTHYRPYRYGSTNPYNGGFYRNKLNNGLYLGKGNLVNYTNTYANRTHHFLEKMLMDQFNKMWNSNNSLDGIKTKQEEWDFFFGTNIFNVEGNATSPPAPLPFNRFRLGPAATPGNSHATYYYDARAKLQNVLSEAFNSFPIYESLKSGLAAQHGFEAFRRICIAQAKANQSEANTFGTLYVGRAAAYDNTSKMRRRWYRTACNKFNRLTGESNDNGFRVSVHYSQTRNHLHPHGYCPLNTIHGAVVLNKQKEILPPTN